MKIFYGVFCIAGVILPYWQFLPWVFENGLNISLFVQEAMQFRIGAFAWLDVLVSAIVLIGFVFAEGSRLKMHTIWWPILGTGLVGVSLGLPLFLLLREYHLESHPKS